jgi:tRNA 2-thiouridine synthesizing protein E
VIEIEGIKIPTDEEGYLVDPAQWNEAVAARLAQNESVVLGEVHWQAIRFMRRYFEEHQIAPDARFVVRHLAKECGLGDEARKRLFELFPYGYVKQACKIAGMRRPRAWSTG